jgi:hypothetical protein
MPYWKCPKCGSKDTYKGTQLQQNVTGSGGGTSIGLIGNEFGDSGITPMLGGQKPIEITSETVETTVRKCKKCDTLLGEKDNHFTQKEKDKHREAQSAEKERERAEKKAERERKKEERKKELAAEKKKDAAEGVSTAKRRGARENATIYLTVIIALPLFVFFMLNDRPLYWGNWSSYICLFVGSIIGALPFSYLPVHFYFKIRYGSTASPRVKRRKTQKPSNPSQVEFKSQNLCKCGDATAILIKENVVEIVGGSEEEKEAVRQWVQENHPEYEIT